ncbi:MAG: hypothetical protein WC655_04300, partial [Candidatus Hydrogenedentales bacterium]
MPLQILISKAVYRFSGSMVSALLLFGAFWPAEAQEPAAAPPANAPLLRAGFARVDVTPAVGMEIPGGFAKNFSTGVHDPLWVEAAYFSNGTVSLAVVGVDLIAIENDMVQDARKQAEARCGIPGGNIMIGARHTHNGGPVNS